MRVSWTDIERHGVSPFFGLTEFRTIAKVQHFIKLPLGAFFPLRAAEKKENQTQVSVVFGKSAINQKDFKPERFNSLANLWSGIFSKLFSPFGKKRKNHKD